MSQNFSFPLKHGNIAKKSERIPPKNIKFKVKRHERNIHYEFIEGRKEARKK